MTSGVVQFRVSGGYARRLAWFSAMTAGGIALAMFVGAPSPIAIGLILAGIAGFSALWSP